MMFTLCDSPNEANIRTYHALKSISIAVALYQLVRQVQFGLSLLVIHLGLRVLLVQ